MVVVNASARWELSRGLLARMHNERTLPLRVSAVAEGPSAGHPAWIADMRSGPAGRRAFQPDLGRLSYAT